MVGCNEKTIRSALKGKIPGPDILSRIATKELPAAWLIGGVDNNTANISTGNINGDVISQSIGIEQHHPAASQPNSSAPTIELSPMEHEIILLMREHMSMAEQRALLLELRSEAAKFA